MSRAEPTPPSGWPQVIVVNGPSSAGKSTLCCALRDRVEHPYLHVAFDDFVFMAAPRYYRGADSPVQDVHDDCTRLGVRMVSVNRDGEPLEVVAEFGPVFRRILDGMAPAVRALVENGNDVIFDHVLHDEQMRASLDRALEGLDVCRVGVACPLDVLEQRERERGDRVLGRARGLDRVVHALLDYDVMVDTGRLGPDECVDAVVAALAARRSRGGAHT